MRAYFGTRFSKNMTRTPEGFLICHNVPIGRTGMYKYLGEEIGVNEKRGQVVQVYRSPDEVFSPSSMASFEGKITTDEHPPELITPDNSQRYTKGTVQNVRQGAGADSDLLIADLVIYDATLISEIEDGKREVSSGYECTYEESEDGTYNQRQICGNHVAVVKDGRAGDRVAIQDSNERMEGAKNNMTNKTQIPRKHSSVKDFFVALGLKQFATDAEPAEIMDAMDEMTAEKQATEPVKEEPTKPSTDADPLQEILAALKGIDQRLTSLEKAEEAEVKPEAEMDAMISELAKKEENEQGDESESQTIPVEEMDESLIPGEVSEPADRPKNPLSTDSAAMIKAIQTMKPIIANMKDPAEKKIAMDSLKAEFNKVKKGNGQNGYKNIAKAQQKTVKQQSQDSSKNSQEAVEKIYADIAKNHNAQLKNKGAK